MGLRDAREKYSALNPDKMSMHANVRNSKELELTPEKYEYAGPNKIRITFRTGLGETMIAVMATARLIRSINMAEALIAADAAQVFKDLQVF